MRSVTLQSYKQDKYHPPVVRAVAAILARSDVVAPVEVLIEMGKLTREHHDAWRRGQIAYLERVIEANLSKASRILRILAFHARDLGMVPSHTAYHRWGKGKKTPLRFSKSGIPAIEDAYSRHCLWKRPQEEKPHGPLEREVPDRLAPDEP